jgi:extracellular factor (EF) 3-hydroxypalmitic acid methyl ester biosynthesis protein
MHAHLLRLTRFLVSFEVYNANGMLRLTEVLSEFRILFQDRLIYKGKAVVASLVTTGSTFICEATLDEASWTDVEFCTQMLQPGGLRDKFNEFLREWQKLYLVLPEYKLVIADMQSFFADLKLWLDQVELGIRSSPSADRLKLEQVTAERIADLVIPSINSLFERFEHIADKLTPEIEPAHRSYMRRQLHSFIMCSPFAHRAFFKPLGYAGDYELVNMMARNVHEGSSLFAKTINTWFLRQPPAEAHRNRIRDLVKRLLAETIRVNNAGRDARIFNVACGPAQEVQQFLIEHRSSSRAQITLLDFNEETLRFTRSTLEGISAEFGRSECLQFVKKSVHHILKESGRTFERSLQNQYDFVYCAGLFDYLSDAVCRRLMDIMYEWLAPGGLLVVTNVEPRNPHRHGMEHLLDWHLIYRNGPQMTTLTPRKADADSAPVVIDETGFNVFLEVRKPGHA